MFIVADLVSLTNAGWVSMKLLGSLKYQASITVMVSYILDRKRNA